MLPAEAKDLVSLESSSNSCSGIASESLRLTSDHILLILALESMDLCPIISYLREDVEKEEILVTDGLLSVPTSMDGSLDMAEKRDMEIPEMDGLLSLPTSIEESLETIREILLSTSMDESLEMPEMDGLLSMDESRGSSDIRDVDAERLVSLAASTDESLDILEVDGLVSLEIRVKDDCSKLGDGTGDGV